MTKLQSKLVMHKLKGEHDWVLLESEVQSFKQKQQCKVCKITRETEDFNSLIFGGGGGGGAGGQLIVTASGSAGGYGHVGIPISGAAGSSSIQVLTSQHVPPGQAIMLHQTKGKNAGNWELNEIASNNGQCMDLAYPLTHKYGSGAVLIPAAK